MPVIDATGGTGRCVVENALRQGTVSAGTLPTLMGACVRPRYAASTAVPPSGPRAGLDRQLWGGEISTADDSSGSAAEVERRLPGPSNLPDVLIGDPPERRVNICLLIQPGGNTDGRWY